MIGFGEEGVAPEGIEEWAIFGRYAQNPRLCLPHGLLGEIATLSISYPEGKMEQSLQRQPTTKTVVVIKPLFETHLGLALVGDVAAAVSASAFVAPFVW